MGGTLARCLAPKEETWAGDPLLAPYFRKVVLLWSSMGRADATTGEVQSHLSEIEYDIEYIDGSGTPSLLFEHTAR